MIDEDKLREIVQYEIEATQDHCPVRGNAMASGDDEFDKEVEDKIIESLNNGNVWAWASVKMTATIPDIAVEGVDYLGCCSYESEEAFKADGYYEDMKEEAFQDLFKELNSLEVMIGNVQS